MRLWAQVSGDEKAMVKVQLWSADKGEAQAKVGILMRVELGSGSQVTTNARCRRKSRREARATTKLR